jgi:glutamine amidotransferase
MSNKKEVVIIDYGLGNLLSLQRAIEKCNMKVVITNNPNIILDSQRVILPGVGAFAKGMKELEIRGLDKVIRNLFLKGTPLLGICLGMQLFFDSSEEFGFTKGLGILSGQVIPIPTIDKEGMPLKIPNNGWRPLSVANNSCWKKSVLKNWSFAEKEYYFIHSYMVSPNDASVRVADCIYGGYRVPAFVIKQNLIGFQFHPEKSGKAGLALLQKFIKYE